MSLLIAEGLELLVAVYGSRIEKNQQAAAQLRD
jgi:hypothetical protein